MPMKLCLGHKLKAITRIQLVGYKDSKHFLYVFFKTALEDILRLFFQFAILSKFTFVKDGVYSGDTRYYCYSFK